MNISIGVNPVRRKRTHYSTRTFGASKPAAYTPFSFDAGFGFPDQNADGRPHGCRAYTQLAVCQDQDRTRYDLDHLAQAIADIEGYAPFSAGDVEDALKAVCVNGLQEPGQTDAGTHNRGRYFMLEKQPGMDWFDSAIANMLATGSPLSIASPWFEAFEDAPRGVFPSTFPLRWGDQEGHNHEGYGLDLIKGEPAIVDKSWQGTSWGDHGKGYWTRAAFNNLLDIPGAAAFLVAKWDGSVTTIRTGILYRLQILLRLYGRLLARMAGSVFGV